MMTTLDSWAESATEAPQPRYLPRPSRTATWPFEGLLEAMTSSTPQGTWVLALMLFSPEAMTDAQTVRFQPVVQVRPVPLALVPPIPRQNELERLRELTGLSMEQLAELFDVSRGALYKWREGAVPRGERQAHLQEALQFAEAAAEQFQGTAALNAWLQRPISAGERTPLQLMAERRWRVLRGLLVQARGSPLRHVPKPFPGPLPQRSAEELREAAERLSPRSALEDLEPEEPEAPEEPQGA
jgi:transcriptional regulator with XRE-family HTH domain